MLNNILTNYICPDVSQTIINLKQTYETIDKYNKVIKELKEAKRSNTSYTMFFNYKINNNRFISVWCPFCGDPCFLTFSGVCCDEHGLVVADCNEMHLSAFAYADIFLLYYEERQSILTWYLTCYDFF